MATVLICLIVITVLLLMVVVVKKNKISRDKLEDDFYIKREKTGEDYGNIYSNSAFEMEVEDVFSITGRGTVLTGKIKSGVIRVGDKVFIKKADGTVLEDIVNGIESFRKKRDTAGVGDNIGLLLKNTKKDRLQRGDRITK